MKVNNDDHKENYINGILKISLSRGKIIEIILETEIVSKIINVILMKLGSLRTAHQIIHKLDFYINYLIINAIQDK